MTDAASGRTVIAKHSIPRLLGAASVSALAGIGPLVALLVAPETGIVESLATAIFIAWITILTVCTPLFFWTSLTAAAAAATGGAAIYSDGEMLRFNLTENSVPIRSYRAVPRAIADIRRMKPGPRWPWGGEPLFITILCREASDLTIMTLFLATPVREIAANLGSVGVRTEGFSPPRPFPQA